MTQAEVTHRVSVNSDACYDVRVGRWPSMLARIGGCRYDFRAGANNALYVGIDCQLGVEKSESRVKYAIDLGRPVRVRRIDQSLWGSAPELKTHEGKRAPVVLQPKGIDYRGHFLDISGPKWWDEDYYAALLSPREHRIALNSREGGSSYPGPFEPGRILSKGRYRIDIYDVESGRRVLLIQSTFHGGAEADPNDFQGEAFWLTDRYYVVPLEPHGMRRLLICDVDAAVSKSVGAGSERK